jgi:hypothetical protein
MYVAVRHEQMYRRRRRIASLFALLAGLGLGLLTLVIIPPPDSDSLLKVARCEEDQSCWDCDTMGNGYCGPLSVIKKNGKDYIVDNRGKIIGEISEP